MTVSLCIEHDFNKSAMGTNSNDIPWKNNELEQQFLEVVLELLGLVGKARMRDARGAVSRRLDTLILVNFHSSWHVVSCLFLLHCSHPELTYPMKDLTKTNPRSDSFKTCFRK